MARHWGIACHSDCVWREAAQQGAFHACRHVSSDVSRHCLLGLSQVVAVCVHAYETGCGLGTMVNPPTLCWHDVVMSHFVTIPCAPDTAESCFNAWLNPARL
jgi:hypothetical protein